MKVISEPVVTPRDVTTLVDFQADGGAILRFISYGPIVVVTMTADEVASLRDKLTGEV